MAPGLYGLMGTLPPRGAHLSGSRQLILRITEKKTWIQDIDISPTKIWITLSCVCVCVVRFGFGFGFGFCKPRILES
mgnify:CR=1 FL=1